MGRSIAAARRFNFVAAEVARRALASVNQEALWRKLLLHKDARIVMEALRYLTDRVAGKPAQMVIGDPNRPVAVQLQWSAAMPDWMSPDVVNVTPTSVEASSTAAPDVSKPALPRKSLFDVE